MDRSEVIRRLNLYLPRYAAHGQEVHWVGPVPVINRALVLFGSSLRKEDGIGDVDLASVIWAPGWGAWGFLLNTLAGRFFTDQPGQDRAYRKVRRAASPLARLVQVQFMDDWPPEDLYRAGKETPDQAGPVDSWMVLWSQEEQDWKGKVRQFEAGAITTPESGWERIDDYVEDHRRLREHVGVSGREWVNTPQFLWVKVLVSVLRAWQDLDAALRERLLPEEALGRHLREMPEEMARTAGDPVLGIALFCILDEVWCEIVGRGLPHL